MASNVTNPLRKERTYKEVFYTGINDKVKLKYKGKEHCRIIYPDGHEGLVPVKQIKSLEEVAVK